MKNLALILFISVWGMAVCAEPQVIGLGFYSTPVPGWSKGRLEGVLLGDNSGFIIRDKHSELGEFDDAETFKIDTPLQLPYGKKIITLDIMVAESMKPLWENKLLQFQVNGRELAAATTESGALQFEKEFGDDGKGFVTVNNGTYQFEIKKEVTDIQFLSFMTAGATNFEMTMKNVSIEVWPEEDVRPRPYLIRFNRLGYVEGQNAPAILEWQNDLATRELSFTIKQSGSESIKKLVSPDALNKDSGLEITEFSLPNVDSGFYTLVIPKTVVRTKHTTAVYQVRPTLSEYQKARDEALGAFHWFDMRTYPGAHEQDRKAKIFGTNQQLDVYGGWYDAGDYGRYSVNGAFTVHMLLLSYISNPEAFPTNIEPLNRYDENRPALLDVVLTELMFLEKMQRADGAVYHKVNSKDWPLLTDAPTDDHDPKYVMPISTTATAGFAAVMDLASFVFDEYGAAEDSLLAQRFRTAGKKAHTFLSNNPDMIMIQDKYDGWEYGGPYTDTDESDERLLAEVTKAWHGETLSVDVQSQLLKLSNSSRFGDEAPDWKNVRFLAVFSALLQPSFDSEFREKLTTNVIKEFSRLREIQNKNPYGIMYAGSRDQFDWGSNGVIATVGTQLLWLAKITDDKKWSRAAFDMSHWFFGVNPHGIIFTTGKSRFNAKQPHFRPLISEAVRSPYGLLVGGPNSVELKGDIAAAPLEKKAPMQVYIDNKESWATNEVAINWQGAWASYLSLLTQ